MVVTLEHHTPLSVMVKGGRTCWDSHCRGGDYEDMVDTLEDVDVSFLDRIINKHKHGSVSEHVNYNFYIQGLSRAALQELARHRHASLSVKSTRYTLKELKSELPFTYELHSLESYKSNEAQRASKYILLLGEHQEYFPKDSTTIEKLLLTDNSSLRALESVRKLVELGTANDCLKYALPECYRTTLMWSVNVRGLKNFLSLRSSPAALWEMRLLAKKIKDVLPQSHQFLYENLEDH